jgi:hypothetical protein
MKERSMSATEKTKPGLRQAYEAVLSEKHYLEATGDPSGLLEGVEAALASIEEVHGHDLEKN